MRLEVRPPCSGVRWKPEVRVLGIDDGPSQRGDARVPLVGVATRASSGYVEAVLHAEVAGDGDDATDVMARMVEECRIRPNLVAVVVHNVVVAGFNTVDVQALHERTGLPVLAVSRGRQDWDAMRTALLEGSITGGEAKWGRIAYAQEREIKLRKTTLVPAGLAPDEAMELARLATVRGHMPEPLRLAHLIGAGWVLGQSRGQ